MEKPAKRLLVANDGGCKRRVDEGGAPVEGPGRWAGREEARL